MKISNTQGRIIRTCYIVCFSVMAAVACLPQSFAQTPGNSTGEPWNKAQVIMPEELAKLLAKPGGKKPAIACVGFEFLFKGAHVPGAQFAGPGREPKGIEALKSWIRSVPKDRDIIVYCGCCPMTVCPNLRPAFEALREVRPSHIRILYLEDSLAKDWVDKGYPVEKGAGM